MNYPAASCEVSVLWLQPSHPRRRVSRKNITDWIPAFSGNDKAAVPPQRDGELDP